MSDSKCPICEYNRPSLIYPIGETHKKQLMIHKAVIEQVGHHSTKTIYFSFPGTRRFKYIYESSPSHGFSSIYDEDGKIIYSTTYPNTNTNLGKELESLIQKIHTDERIVYIDRETDLQQMLKYIGLDPSIKNELQDYRINLTDISEIKAKLNELLQKEQARKKSRITPDLIQELKSNEIFVFGSNELGRHGAGAAKTALKWGAVYGKGFGLYGQTFAIPTKNTKIETLSLNVIKRYVDKFINMASRESYQKFLVTEIGCGLAGYTPKEIAPLFKKAKKFNNISLPQKFWDELKN